MPLSANYSQWRVQTCWTDPYFYITTLNETSELKSCILAMRGLLDLHSLDDRNSLRSWLGPTRNQESGHLAICGELAKTSGIMALAVDFGVASLPRHLMDAFSLEARAVVASLHNACAQPLTAPGLRRLSYSYSAPQITQIGSYLPGYLHYILITKTVGGNLRDVKLGRARG